MTLIDQINTLKRIDQLVRIKATGSPEDLAQRLNVSRASVYRYIEVLKHFGAPVTYCKQRKTFYYEQKFTLHL